MQRIRNPQEEAEGGKRRQKEDLSLPADVEQAPRAPSQQPGQFTSCKIDWLTMDPCPCVAANSELIKENFSGETLSSNQAHPIYSREIKHVALKPFPVNQNRCHCTVCWEIAWATENTPRQNICSVLLKVGKYVGEIVSILCPDIQLWEGQGFGGSRILEIRIFTADKPLQNWMAAITRSCYITCWLSQPLKRHTLRYSSFGINFTTRFHFR